MGAHRWMWITWPAFCVAALLELLVFTVLDPQDMLWLGQSAQWSRTAIYSVAFLVFWGAAALGSAMTLLLAGTPGARVQQV